MTEKFCITNDTGRKTALMILFEGMNMIRKCACVFSFRFVFDQERAYEHICLRQYKTMVKRNNCLLMIFTYQYKSISFPLWSALIPPNIRANAYYERARLSQAAPEVKQMEIPGHAQIKRIRRICFGSGCGYRLRI